MPHCRKRLLKIHLKTWEKKAGCYLNPTCRKDLGGQGFWWEGELCCHTAAHDRKLTRCLLSLLYFYHPRTEETDRCVSCAEDLPNRTSTPPQPLKDPSSPKPPRSLRRAATLETKPKTRRALQRDSSDTSLSSSDFFPPRERFIRCSQDVASHYD